MKTYTVIGGQYRYHNYGEFDSLKAARSFATDHDEYWDNYQGWHVPCIYLTETLTDGYPTADSVCVGQKIGRKWVNPSEWN